MPTRIGYIGQWNYYVGGNEEINRIPIVQGDAIGNYVNTWYTWVPGPITYHGYYTVSQPQLQLGPYEYPTSIAFSDYSTYDEATDRSDGHWTSSDPGSEHSHTVTIGVFGGDASVTPSVVYDFVEKSIGFGANDKLSATWNIPTNIGKQMVGQLMNIRAWNRGTQLHGYCKVTITTEYTFTHCGAPTNVAGSLPQNGQITLTWGAGSDGVANAITAYEIQYSDSNDGVNWGPWYAQSRVAANVLTAQVWNNPQSGKFRRFQVRAVGAAGAGWESGWVISNAIPTNDTPPTFTATVTSVTNTGVLHPVTAGIHIRGLTKIKADITNAQGSPPKTIAGYAIDMQQYGKASANTMTSGVVNAVGNVVITYSVTDSQGYSASTTKTITVQDYYSPGVQVAFTRCRDVNKTPDPLGSYIMYRATTTFTNIDGNAIASVVATINGVNYNLIADGGWYILSGYTQDPTVRRDVTVTVTDKFTSFSIQTMILSANYAIYLNENGTGIGFGTATSRANSVEIGLGRTLYVPNITIIPTTPGGPEYT